MNTHLPSDEDLNSYVDGELSAHDRARVAHAVAADPVLADRVATLARLKSSVAGLTGDRPLTLADLGIAAPRRRLPRHRIAASFLAAFLVGGIAMAGYWGWRTTATEAWVAAAKTRHAAWLQERQEEAPDNAFAGLIHAALIHKTMRRLDFPAHIPDMRSAKLALSDVVYFETTEKDRAQSLQLRYTGRRGCRVSLWLSHGVSPLGTALSESNDGRARGFYWRIGDVSYALFATGMDVTRFTLLARNVYESTRGNGRPPAQHEDELRVATDAAVPCRA